MSELAKILKRTNVGNKTSLVNEIDKVLLRDPEIFSARKVNIAIAELVAASKSGKRHELQKAFNNLKNAIEAPRNRDDNYIHVSALESGCPRMFYYRIKGVPKTNPPHKFDAKTLRIFDVGTFYHSYLQKALYESGLLVQDEVMVYNAGYYLFGYNDGVLFVDGKNKGLEIKTINSFGFSKVKKNNRPLDSHMSQASVYDHELNLGHYIFLYVNKDNGEIHEIEVTRKDFAPYKDEQYEKLSYIKGHVESNVPPERVCKKATDDTAAGCSYCNHCFNLK